MDAHFETEIRGVSKAAMRPACRPNKQVHEAHQKRGHRGDREQRINASDIRKQLIRGGKVGGCAGLLGVPSLLNPAPSVVTTPVQSFGMKIIKHLNVSRIQNRSSSEAGRLEMPPNPHTGKLDGTSAGTWSQQSTASPQNTW